jgi:DNA-3-methyladenine glycosylase II
LRAAGLSGAKAKYVQELAGKVTDGTIVLDDLGALPDEEVTRVLSQVKGIGPWSTHMFLIFRLHRPDVWPIGDLAIVRALQRYHGFRKVPAIKRLEKMGDNWRPYRSLAAWYLWASLSLKADD